MTNYKKGAMRTDSPNVLYNGRLHINCKDKELLRLTGWAKVKEASIWARIWEAVKRGLTQ